MTRPRSLLFRLCLASLVLAGAAAARAATGAEKHGPAPEPPAPAVTSSHAPLDAPPAAAAAGHSTTEPAKAPGHEPVGESTKPGKASKSGNSNHAKTSATHSAAAAKQLTEDELQSLLRLGPTLAERGDYQAAEIAFHRVLSMPTASDAKIKEALLGLARMHRKQGAPTKSVAIYERFIKDFPADDRTPDAYLELGRTFRALGVHKLAIARFYSVLNSTLKINDGNFEHYQLLARTAQFEIAQTYFEAGQYAEANKFFTRLRLLELAPSDRARAHFMSAYSLRLQGDLEGTITTLRSFIEQCPDDENIPEARYLLAISLRELKRPQEAYAATLELLRTEKVRTALDPKRWAYWQRRTGNQLANDFFESGDMLGAHTIYASLLELSPEPAWRLPILYQIGLCYERLSSFESARKSYQSIIDSTGTTPTPEMTELSKLATWRIDHLAWRENVEQQVASVFSSTTGKTPPPTTPPATPPAKTEANP